MTRHRDAGRVTFAKDVAPLNPNLAVRPRPRIVDAREDAFDTRHEFTRTDTAELARNLSTAFIWGETQEGHAFWSDIWARLRAIARTAPVGDGLPMELERAFPCGEAEGGVREHFSVQGHRAGMTREVFQ